MLVVSTALGFPVCPELPLSRHTAETPGQMWLGGGGGGQARQRGHPPSPVTLLRLELCSALLLLPAGLLS